jgi:hypothetical protein
MLPYTARCPIQHDALYITVRYIARCAQHASRTSLAQLPQTVRLSSLVVLLIAECRDPTVTSILAHPVCSVAILDGLRLSSRIVVEADQPEITDIRDVYVHRRLTASRV